MFKVATNINRSGKEVTGNSSSSSPGLIDPVPRAEEEFHGFVIFFDNGGSIVSDDAIISGSYDAPVYAAFCTSAGKTTALGQNITVYRVESVGAVRAISHEFTMASGKTGVTVKHSTVMTPGRSGIYSNRYYLDTWITLSAERLTVGADQLVMLRPAYDAMSGLTPSTLTWNINFPAEPTDSAAIGTINFTESGSSGNRSDVISAMRSIFGTVQCSSAYRVLDPHLRVSTGAGKILESCVSFAYPIAVQKGGAAAWWLCWAISGTDITVGLIKQGDESTLAMEISDAASIALCSSETP